MEEELIQWIKNEYQITGSLPERKQIKAQAKDRSTVPNFRASKGWCDKFIKRN